MQPVEEAIIPCVAVDGTRIANVTIASDMKDVSLVGLAPILQVAPETATFDGETEYQLRENARYEYAVHDCSGLNVDFRLRCTLARRRRTLRANEPDAGRIETGSFCGTLLLEIVLNDAGDLNQSALASALIDVRSIKLDYRSEYRGMLRDISQRMADLIADARSSTTSPFRSNFEQRQDTGWFQIQLELLREIIESFEFMNAMHRIVAYPHERVEHEVEMIDVGRPFKWSRSAIGTLMSSPVRRKISLEHPLRNITQLDSIAAKVDVPQKIRTIDTPENRFIKFVLREFQVFLSGAERVFNNAGSAWFLAARLAGRLLRVIEQWLARPFFKELSAPQSLPLGSPVLQRKGGYREILRMWLRFRSAAELSWDGGADLFRVGQRDVAQLYEYWLFFNLLDWFCRRFDRDGEVPLIEQLISGLDTDSPNLRLSRRNSLGPFCGNLLNPGRRLYAALSYSREFRFTSARHQGGSWTRKMHPDYTLTFWPVIEGMTPEDSATLAEEQELLVHIHLDAKYRVAKLEELFGTSNDDADDEDTTGVGNYKRQDLLKMHAYRDAIKRSEGAYILYPGDETCRNNEFNSEGEGAERWPHIMWGFHEIIPGLGAFAITPDSDGRPLGMSHLTSFLEEVLMNLSNRASFRERRTASLYERLREQRSLNQSGDSTDRGAAMLQHAPELDADHLRLPATPDIMVLVGWFDDYASKNWMVNNGKVVLRLGDRRGSLPLIRSLSAATHILLHGRGGVVVPGLGRILPEVGRVFTRAEILKIGFPTDPKKDQDQIFAVFSFTPDHSFAHLCWEASKLNIALTRFLNRQRPTYRLQLKRLTHILAHPFIVSLADLEEALVTL